MAVLYVGESQLKYFRISKPSLVRSTSGARIEDLVHDLCDLSAFKVSSLI